MTNNMTQIIEESFGQYAGAVLQSRALVDVRDCLKPSARQIFYCLYTDKFTADKPFKKTLKAIGSSMRMYIHGDSSCEGIIMRSGQPFSMRYPLVEVEGSYGNLMESGNWAAPRYTAARLSSITNNLFTSIDKDTIEDWRDNYDDTEQYPAVLPSLGYYNIVNGTMGIGVALASSIPQFNLREVNDALIKLLWNEDATFDELYCAPDFATGGIILNEEEVKRSLQNGNGPSIRLRSVIDFNEAGRYFEVKEIPYGVYTNTICQQLEELELNNPSCGISHHNDLTGSTPCIKIYLTKGAKPEKVLRTLYKETSLQSYYGINMTMLDKGMEPKVFGWKQALQIHLNHEKKCYRAAFEYDLKKYQARLHIVEGIIKAISIIDQVVDTIRKSSSTITAKTNLMNNFGFTEPQAKAILDIKLARLASLELAKYQEEAANLQEKIDNITLILNNEVLFKQEIEKGFNEVAAKYGDARRTKILNIESVEEEEPQEVENYNLFLTNKDRILVQKTSSLFTGSRNSVGTKFKLNSNEVIISAIENTSTNPAIIITSLGKGYLLDSFSEGIINLNDIFTFENNEECKLIVPITENTQDFFFITKKGLVKRGKIADYIPPKKKSGVTLIKFKTLDDELVSAFLCGQEKKIGVATSDAHFTIFNASEVEPLKSRTAIGVKAITLKNDAYVIAAVPLDNENELVTITSDGYIKRTSLSNFAVSGRGGVGVLAHKLSENTLIDALPIKATTNTLKIVASRTVSQIPIQEIPLLDRNTVGVKAIKLKPEEIVKGVFL